MLALHANLLLFVMLSSTLTGARDSLVLENEHLLIEFSADDGSIIQVQNKQKQLDLISVLPPARQPWALLLAPFDLVSDIEEFRFARDEDDPAEKLKLEWKTIDEGFRQLVLSINDDLMIRRISGVTSSFQEVQLDFEEIIVNQNLPEGKFRYDSPPSANVINNFIFVPEEE